MTKLILVAGFVTFLIGPAAAATNEAHTLSTPVAQASEATTQTSPVLSPDQRIDIQERCEKAGIGMATTGLISSGLTAEEQAFCQAFTK